MVKKRKFSPEKKFSPTKRAKHLPQKEKNFSFVKLRDQLGRLIKLKEQPPQQQIIINVENEDRSEAEQPITIDSPVQALDFTEDYNAFYALDTNDNDVNDEQVGEDVLDLAQKPAETDPNDFLAGLNWKEFANYEAQNQQVDSNDVVVLPQPCRNQQEIADQLRVLVEQQAQRSANQGNESLGIYQEDGEELDDDIVCLGEVRDGISFPEQTVEELVKVNLIDTQGLSKKQPSPKKKSLPKKQLSPKKKPSLEKKKKQLPERHELEEQQASRMPQASTMQGVSGIKQAPSFQQSTTMQQGQQPTTVRQGQSGQQFFASNIPTSSDLHSHRPFRTITVGDSDRKIMDKTGFLIRLCTFNVLCETTKNKCAYLYGESTQQKINWDDRKQLLTNEITTLNADVFCLQEVQEDHYIDFYEPLFHRVGFKGIFTRRGGIDNVDGCMLAYRIEKFTELKYEHVFYNYDSAGFDKNNVGQLILLQEKQTKLRFVVANTHILFNMKRGDVKTGQVALLLASIERFTMSMRFDDEYSGVLLCGDFNIEPNSPIYDFILQGALKYSTFSSQELAFEHKTQRFVTRNPEQFRVAASVPLNPNTCTLVPIDSTKNFVSIDTLFHKHCFLSAYRHRIDNNEREISTYHKHFGCPDFIFYSAYNSPFNGRVEENRIMLRRLLMLPSLNVIQNTCGPMPNYQCGSDHLPLMAEFFIC